MLEQKEVNIKANNKAYTIVVLVCKTLKVKEFYNEIILRFAYLVVLNPAGLGLYSTSDWHSVHSTLYVVSWRPPR